LAAKFWDLVERFKTDPDAVEEQFREMSRDELRAFYKRWMEQAADLQDDEFREHLPEDTSEDHLEDIAFYVLSQGKKSYDSVMLDPSKIPSTIPDGWGGDIVPGRALRVWKQRFDGFIQDDD
jgi:hypothetical protein